MDLGCGQGASTWFLAREGFKVVSVDGSVTAVLKAEARMKKEKLPFSGISCCMTKLPVRTNEFDAVVDVVASVYNTETDFAGIWCNEIPRVLKPGGKIFSVMPTSTCSRRAFKGMGIVTFIDRDEIEHLLHDKYENIEILYSGYDLAKGFSIENWIVTADRSA